MGRHDAWDAGPTYQREILRHRQAAWARASARHRFWRNAVVITMAILAIGVTTGVIERDTELQPLEQRLR